MTSQARVLNVLNNENPDRGVTDFQAVPEVWQKLKRTLKISNNDALLKALEIDCRWIYPEYKGLQTEIRPDGAFKGWGGSWLVTVCNEYGRYFIEYGNPTGTGSSSDWAMY